MEPSGLPKRFIELMRRDPNIEILNGICKFLDDRIQFEPVYLGPLPEGAGAIPRHASPVSRRPGLSGSKADDLAVPVDIAMKPNNQRDDCRPPKGDRTLRLQFRFDAFDAIKWDTLAALTTGRDPAWQRFGNATTSDCLLHCVDHTVRARLKYYLATGNDSHRLFFVWNETDGEHTISDLDRDIDPVFPRRWTAYDKRTVDLESNQDQVHHEENPLHKIETSELRRDIAKALKEPRRETSALDKLSVGRLTAAEATRPTQAEIGKRAARLDGRAEPYSQSAVHKHEKAVRDWLGDRLDGHR